MKQSPQDIRKYTRMDSLILIKVIMDETVIDGLVENIGFGGVKLRVPIYIKPHRHVELEIHYKEIGIKVGAKCIWIKPVEGKNSQYYVGLSFHEVDGETYRQIRELLLYFFDGIKNEE